ncbi:MAG: putative integral rane protein [Frankiaceae bacterium]|nr:putative integral rane protein [Frankiaceae bacterium]
MYAIALFIHVVGVVLLAGAVALSAACYFAARRATDIAGLRSALALLPATERLMPFAIPLILLAGLYMVGKHGDDGGIAWSNAWVIVSLVMFVVMAIAGSGIEGPRLSALHKRALAAPDGAISPDLDTLRRDPVVRSIMFFGFAMITGFLFLMTVKPEPVISAVAVPVVATIVFLGLAQLAFRKETSAPPLHTDIQ